jgi:hypothetical protein
MRSPRLPRGLLAATITIGVGAFPVTARSADGLQEAAPLIFGGITLGAVVGVTVNVLPFVAETQVRSDGSLAGGWLATEYIAFAVNTGTGVAALSLIEDGDTRGAIAGPALALGVVWGTFAVIRTVNNVERARLRSTEVRPYAARAPGPDGGWTVGLSGRF